MKKILIVNNNMQIGGIQKSLANLLSEISDKYDVSLLLLAPCGDLMKDIPQNVKLICANPLVSVLGLSHAQAKKKGVFPLLWRGALTVMTRIFKTRVVFNLLSHMENISGEYDAAISYMQNGAANCFYGGCAELVLNAVHAAKKICFIHCDFENYEGRCEYNIKTLIKFDKIAAVSNSVAKKLINVAPMLKDKVMTVHNCYNIEQIKSLSKAYDAPRTAGSVNIFSAARLRYEKGIVRMIPIFKEIRDAGVDFIWRIAGDGQDRAEAERLIDKYNLSEQIILLGNLENPYPYFKAADVLLVPSYDEAAPMVFGEAQILGTPVFTTDTSSAREMVEEPNIGRVAANDDNTLLYELTAFLKDFNNLEFDKKDLVNNICEFDELIEN